MAADPMRHFEQRRARIPALPANRSDDSHPERLIRSGNDYSSRELADDESNVELLPSTSGAGCAHDNHGGLLSCCETLLAFNQCGVNVSHGTSGRSESLRPTNGSAVGRAPLHGVTVRLLPELESQRTATIFGPIRGFVKKKLICGYSQVILNTNEG
jgi:hypothetical protein